MRFFSANSKLRLSTKLFLTNLLTSLAFLLIAGFIVYSFFAVGTKSADVANTDVENAIQNSRLTRGLSEIFSQIDLLDEKLYGNSEYLRSEGRRLASEIMAVQRSTNIQALKASLSEVSNQFNLFLSQGIVVNEALKSRDLVDEEIEKELATLEQLIGDWLIESTLQGKDTDFVTQQLALVIGYRESSLLIGKLYAEMNLDARSNSPLLQNSPVMEAVDDLALRLQTLTASTPDVAARAEAIKDKVLVHRASIERVFTENAHLNSLRAELNVSKGRVLSVMETIESELSIAAQSAGERIEEIVTFAAMAVVLSTLVAIALVFFTTRQLIRFNIQRPLRTILGGIETLRTGDLSSKIELGREDEWEMIGQSLNDMATELQEAQQQLIVNERLATLGQLAGTVSHELRNPLGTIDASSQVLRARTEGKELKIEPTLDRIERSIRRCNTIIEDLLQFARTKDRSYETTFIDQWVGATLDEFTVPEGMSLIRALNSGIEIPVDPESLRRALINVVENALQAMEEERKVGGSGKEHVLTVSTRLGFERLEISIQDTGPGIALADRQRIFEPLFSTKAFGIGLGMPIVQRILEQHDGGIEVNSEPGEGTEVVLWVPTETRKRAQL